jgi:bifunctional DNA-binding transcriptional regulator/antitoxin component of YhaV-PrlF toxin-antitoxin module
MRDDLIFHAKMDARGKIQIPKREYEALGWGKGTILKIVARKKDGAES